MRKLMAAIMILAGLAVVTPTYAAPAHTKANTTSAKHLKANHAKKHKHKKKAHKGAKKGAKKSGKKSKK